MHISVLRIIKKVKFGKINRVQEDVPLSVSEKVGRH